MFLTHWGLSRSPFGGPLNPADYHASPTHEEALARMMYLIDNGRRLGLLLGQAGTGKSLLLAVTACQLRQAGCQVVCLNLTGLDCARTHLEAGQRLRPSEHACGRTGRLVARNRGPTGGQSLSATDHRGAVG